MTSELHIVSLRSIHIISNMTFVDVTVGRSVFLTLYLIIG